MSDAAEILLGLGVRRSCREECERLGVEPDDAILQVASMSLASSLIDVAGATFDGETQAEEAAALAISLAREIGKLFAHLIVRARDE